MLIGAVLLTAVCAMPGSVLAVDYEQEISQAMHVNSMQGINISNITGGLDLESYMMQIQSERARLLEQQMQQLIAEVQERQKQIVKWNEQLANLDPESAEAMAIKAQLDAMTGTSQLDMLRLQALTDKRNEAFEQLTNTLQKFAKARESIIGNMR